MAVGKKRSERIQANLESSTSKLTPWRQSKEGTDFRDERISSCYATILEGGTKRQVAERHQIKFNITLESAFIDYDDALKLLIEEQNSTTAKLREIVQAMRFVGLKKALVKGNLQAYAMMLKDLTTELGVDGAAEDINLNISIEASKPDKE